MGKSAADSASASLHAVSRLETVQKQYILGLPKHAQDAVPALLSWKGSVQQSALPSVPAAIQILYIS